MINYSDEQHSGYTNNPYGSKNGLCLGLSGNIKRVSRKHVLLGGDLGVEVLRSKIAINRISGYDGSATYNYEATGQTYLKFVFMNMHPFVGYRLIIENTNVDLIGGLEIGYCMNAKEAGKAVAANGNQYETSVDRRTINLDVRPRMQLGIEYKKVGGYIGYSMGLANYMYGYIGGTNDCYARILRFGLAYKIK
jgi:hypothetical protein